MDKVNRYSICALLCVALSWGCSGIKESTKGTMHQGLTIYATDWKKHTFRPLALSALQSEENFVVHKETVPASLAAIMEKVKTKPFRPAPRLNCRVLLFVGADTLMVSKDCSIVLNSAVYNVECSSIIEILEATNSLELLEAVNFPKEWYLP